MIYNLAPEVNTISGDDALPLGDNFATGYHGVLNANIKTRGTVVIIGDGEVDQSAIMAARLFVPSTIILVGRHDSRLKLAKTIGATHAANSKNTDPVECIKSLTNGRNSITVPLVM
ncbi:zinc-binding dehydrogenase [Fulvivirga sp. M361]|uniref:zinc-binding dehydrogenase n=1 Tax=Fulvivirga sp. M361 TaxID=2594266 RepID=UPI00117B8045|nr:zinc-binding dehydrogenase [Fulvivirga sp. M361]TRX54324.1 zinc-binding dehydrogenase [Fulvivirga sp. M361]